MIDNYTFGEFTINGKKFRSNIVLINNSVKPGRYLENHELLIKDFDEILAANPEIVIIGTGASGVVKPSEEIKNEIESEGIQLIIEKSGEAIKTYNKLLKQKKKVAAFMHNTC